MDGGQRVSMDGVKSTMQYTWLECCSSVYVFRGIYIVATDFSCCAGLWDQACNKHVWHWFDLQWRWSIVRNVRLENISDVFVVSKVTSGRLMEVVGINRLFYVVQVKFSCAEGPKTGTIHDWSGFSSDQPATMNDWNGFRYLCISMRSTAYDIWMKDISSMVAISAINRVLYMVEMYFTCDGGHWHQPCAIHAWNWYSLNWKTAISIVYYTWMGVIWGAKYVV